MRSVVVFSLPPPRAVPRILRRGAALTTSAAAAFASPCRFPEPCPLSPVPYRLSPDPSKFLRTSNMTPSANNSATFSTAPKLQPTTLYALRPIGRTKTARLSAHLPPMELSSGRAPKTPRGHSALRIPPFRTGHAPRIGAYKRALISQAKHTRRQSTLRGALYPRKTTCFQPLFPRKTGKTLVFFKYVSPPSPLALNPPAQGTKSAQKSKCTQPTGVQL